MSSKLSADDTVAVAVKGEEPRSARCTRVLTTTSTTRDTMFFARLLATARLFSTSAIAQYPKFKLKSHSGAKKRWKSIGSAGVFKRVSPAFRFLPHNTSRGRAGCQCSCYDLQAHGFKSHLNVSKTSNRKNRLSQTAYSTGWQTPKLKKLLPYGSR